MIDSLESRFHPDHLADLRKSGLSDETITEVGIQSVRPRDIYKELGFTIPNLQSMYEIPYGGDHKRYKAFYEAGKEFYADGKRKPKYLQRKGSENRLYIPKRVQLILSDSSVPLYLTEGEKKSLKATQEGLCCIGLSGLWNWSKGNKELISDFGLINLSGRIITIVPDSDWLKPNKHGYPTNMKQAVFGLVAELEKRGAKVFIAMLPQEGAEKVGFDDYLCKNSAKDIIPLLTAAEIDQRAPFFDNFDNFDESLRYISENAIPEYSYPFEIFPEGIQKIIKNYSEALSVESEIIAHNMLVLVSAAIGNSMRIESKASHVEPLFLWGALIQPTGLGKTHAINALMKPIEYKQAEAYQKYLKELKEYIRQLKENKKKLKKDNKKG